MMAGLWKRRSSRGQKWFGAGRGRLQEGRRGAVIEPMEPRLLLAAIDPVISEFMADNRVTLYDEYGEPSDWIEIYNPGTTPVDLGGWYLTDSASDLRQWQFPSVTLSGGSYLLVFASGRDQRAAGQVLHTNFKLDAVGEYLALVKPDGQTVTSQYGTAFPRQVPNVSYGVISEPIMPSLISVGAPGKAIVPSGDMGLDWTLPSFDDSAWPYQGPMGVGFDTNPATGGYFSITEAYSATPIQYYYEAYDLLSNPTGAVYDYTVPAINLMDPQARDGHFPNNAKFQGDTAGKDTNYALRISGVIRVPTTGTWTFGLSSADGFYLNIDGATFSSTTGTDTYSWGGQMVSYRTGTPGDSLGVAKLSAGEHRVEIIFVQGTSGGELEFFAAQGAKTSFDSSFKLVGDSEHGGLQLVSLRESIGTDIQEGMLNTNASAYVRIPFDAVDPASLDRLVLRMKYDDGFVAFLNGHPIAASDSVPSTLAWNSKADYAGQDTDSLIYETFDLTNMKGYLSATEQNVLAIQVLNVSAEDGDLLAMPELLATQRISPDEVRYFVTPTPGRPNNTGVEDLGPVISNMNHTPALPGDADDVVVTATVNPALGEINTVQMHYRVAFGPETTVTMYDDGLHGDGAANDHVYGATIPAGASKGGQMVRYYVTAEDSGDRQSRWPMIPLTDPEPDSTRKWPEYQGFVIPDSTLETSLPVVYWFAANYGAAETRTGTRCSVYYNGEFYDNVFVRSRGGSATGGQKFDFNKGYSFQFDPSLERVSEINLNRQGGIAVDDAWIRPVIAFETFRDAGCPTCISFPLRLQKGTGPSGGEIRIFVEQPDDEYLERQGLYGDGMLFKTPNSDNPEMYPYWFKTKDYSNYEALDAFINGLKQTDPTARARFIFDNVDIATFLDYQAATILVEEMDAVQKNYYLYCDVQNAENPDGTNLWSMLPWDKHLTFGKNWGFPDYQARDPQAHPFLGDRRHPKIDGSHAWNVMIDAVLSVPVIKQMYLRRLRTLMDQLLQPESTPYADRYFETRLDELYNTLIGDPKFKSSASSLRRAFDDIKTKYLAVRRQHLYVDHSLNTKYRDYAGIPAAQVGSPTVNFGTIEFNPASGNQDEEYIELRNPNNVAVDISGWKIEGGIDYEFKPGVVIPANGSLYLSRNLVAFRQRTVGPRGNQGLLVVGPYEGQLSARGETLVLKDGAGNLISSANSEANPTAAQQFLRVTEIMYNPPDDSGADALDNEEFEYVELQNISATEALNLKGVRFTQGIDFAFGEVTLEPGQYVLVVRNRAAFESRYGTGLPIAGEYTTTYLNNKSDRIHLIDAIGESVLDFSYEDDWYSITDHEGRSLVTVDPYAAASAWDGASNWRASTFNPGSPGKADAEVSLGAPTVRVMPVQPEERYTPVDSVTIVFSEAVKGFDLSRVKLTRDGNSVRLTGGPVLRTTDNKTWV
ncbi:MAG TPA: lamin tail domain-containing protein, partial [Tepidisphaeraceae bacterium]|nr:lamin tail domain-containing protein [Tepidisphaeraceae bacterium]